MTPILNSAVYGSSLNTRPLEILHGLFGSLQNWTSIAKQMSKTRTVYALDLRNHGSSFHDSEHNYTAMAQDVRNFIKHHSISEFNILGHSMGAKVAMYLALEGAETNLSKLVLVDMSPKSMPLSRTMRDYIVAMKEIDRRQVSNPKEADQILVDAGISEQAIRSFLLTNLKLMRGRYKFRINLESLYENFSKLGEFSFDDSRICNNSALFIAGTRSDYVLKSDLPKIHSHFPAGQVVWVDAGHWVHAEQPKFVIDRVNEFLD